MELSSVVWGRSPESMFKGQSAFAAERSLNFKYGHGVQRFCYPNQSALISGQQF